jgi:hypothetical protein
MVVGSKLSWQHFSYLEFQDMVHCREPCNSPKWVIDSSFSVGTHQKLPEMDSSKFLLQVFLPGLVACTAKKASYAPVYDNTACMYICSNPARLFKLLLQQTFINSDWFWKIENLPQKSIIFFTRCKMMRSEVFSWVNWIHKQHIDFMILLDRIYLESPKICYSCLSTPSIDTILHFVSCWQCR